MPIPPVTRRTFVTRCTGALAAAACLPETIHAETGSPVIHQAMGTRAAGEHQHLHSGGEHEE